MIDSGKCGDAGVERRAGRLLSQLSRSMRPAALAAALGIGLALGGCSTMSDIGEATSEGVSSAANAMNPFNWFGGKDEEQAKKDEEAGQRAKQERAVANTATKTGIKSAPRDDLAQRAATDADESRYPKLATVPDRPKDVASKKAGQGRTALREGLVADTANAQYTDKELRAQTTPAAPQGQPDLARSNERVAGEPPARPAPTTPVAAEPAPPLPAMASAPATPRVAPAPTPRVAPPQVAPPQVARVEEPTRSYGARQAAAASAAPVTPVAPPTPAAVAPTRQASLVQPPPERPRAVLKTVQVATIYFNDGSARLSANDRRLVDQVAEAARRTGGTIRIVGHSSMGAPAGDSERAALVNYKVSLDRANAVAVELLRSGVPDSRLQVIAEGSRNPIYAETARTGAAGNRRAEVYLDYYEQL